MSRIITYENFAKEGIVTLPGGSWSAVSIAPGSDFDRCKVDGNWLTVGALLPCSGGSKVECLEGWATGDNIFLADGATASQSVAPNYKQSLLHTPLPGALHLQLWESCEFPVPARWRAPKTYEFEYSELAMGATPGFVCVARLPFFGRTRAKVSLVKANAGVGGVAVRLVTYHERELCGRMARPDAVTNPSREELLSYNVENVRPNYTAPIVTTLGLSDPGEQCVQFVVVNEFADEFQFWSDDFADASPYAAADNFMVKIEISGERVAL